MSYWQEIRRRKVFQVAAVYAVVAWLIVQVVGAVNEPLSLPGWLDTVVIILLGVGFPIALVLAWAFDLTPKGIRPANDIDRDEIRARSDSRPLGYVLQALILLAVGFLVLDQYLFDEPGTKTGASASSLSVEPAVARFVFSVPPEQSIREDNITTQIDLSRDGRFFVYGSQNGIYRRNLDETEAQLIQGSSAYRGKPMLSPDGQLVSYYVGTGAQLAILNTAGGAASPATIPDDPLPTLVDWETDGSLLTTQRDGIYRLRLADGSMELLHAAREGERLGSPRWLRAGELLIADARGADASTDEATIIAIAVPTGERTTLYEGGSDARYLPTGHLLFAVGQTMYTIAFDRDSLTTSGVPVAVVENVQRANESRGTNLDVSDNGTLVYLRSFPDQRTLAWIDRQGRVEETGVAPRNFWYIQLSPANDSLVAANVWDAAGRRDVWTIDLKNGTERRISNDAGANRSPIWDPSGKRIAFTRPQEDGSDEFYWRAADLSDTASQLSITGSNFLHTDIAPDGSVLLYQESGPPRDIWALPIGDNPAEGHRLWQSDASEFNARISPDGHWLAYQSNETGRYEIWVRPYPGVDSGGPWQVSTGGGVHPLWGRNPDALELFYLNLNGAETGTGALYAVSIDTKSTFAPRTPQKLFEGNFVVPSNFTGPYDISRDGSRFLMIRPDRSAQEIVVVLNWFEELMRLVPPGH